MIKLNKKIKFCIAVDGSSASGKTSGGKFIGKYFKMNFLSSGTLYRYCALKILKNKNKYNKKFINNIAKSLTMKRLDSKKLYNPEVTKLSSIIAKKPYIRKALKKFQLDFVKNSRLVVCEGRDIGTTIIPNADLKLFFKCSIKEKARRRLKEFKILDNNITLNQVEKALRVRDWLDKTRKISPLIKAKNAILVNTTNLTLSQMRLKLIRLVKKEINKKYGNL